MLSRPLVTGLFVCVKFDPGSVLSSKSSAALTMSANKEDDDPVKSTDKLDVSKSITALLSFDIIVVPNDILGVPELAISVSARGVKTGS